MKPSTIRNSIVACAMCVLLTARVPAVVSPAVVNWFVDSLTKVFPEDVPLKSPAAVPDFVAARNSHLSIQWVLRSRERLANLSVMVEGFEGRADEVPVAQARLVGYVVVSSNTHDTPRSEIIHTAPGLFPDVLLEKFPFTLESNRTQSIWITLNIPSAARPAEYQGRIVLDEGARQLARAAFRLRVDSASVPPEQTLEVTNWLYLSDRQLRGPYGVRQLTEDWWTLIGNIGRVMAEHRQNMISTPLTGFYFSKLALIGAHAAPNGIEYDFANFDRWVETFQRAGLVGSIEGSHVLRREEDPDDPATLKVDAYVVEGGKAVLKALPAGDPKAQSALRPMLIALRRHLQQKGWLSSYYQHVLDEVDDSEMPVYREYAALVHETMPDVRTMDAVDARRDLNVYEKSCDVWVPVLGSFDHLVPRLLQHAKNGDEVWFYTCLVPTDHYANRFIDYALIKTRLLPWFDFRFDLTGYLHWGGNYWSPAPMTDTQAVLGESWASGILPPGDGFIVYPDREQKSILSSIRLEAFREGVEDYELLRVLQQKDRAAAQALAQEAIRTFTDYVRDPATFRRIHQQLLEDLSR